jgi:hypothetical protein
MVVSFVRLVSLQSRVQRLPEGRIPNEAFDVEDLSWRPRLGDQIGPNGLIRNTAPGDGAAWP